MAKKKARITVGAHPSSSVSSACKKGPDQVQKIINAVSKRKSRAVTVKNDPVAAVIYAARKREELAARKRAAKLKSDPVAKVVAAANKFI